MVGFRYPRLAASAAVGAVLMAMAAAAPASATTVIDDFTNQGTFGSVVSDAQTPTEHGATAFYATTHAIGGERDVLTRIDNPVAYVGDNAFGEIFAGGGIIFGRNSLSVPIGFGADGSFRVQYDGVDGSMDVASPGLNLNIAALGDHIGLDGFRNSFLVDGAAAANDLIVTLTDGAGHSASVSQTLAAGLFGLQPLAYNFSAFQAANSQLNFQHIASIELSGSLKQQSPLTGDLEVGDFVIDGNAFAWTPDDTGSGTTDGNSTSGAPEPGVWMLAILGFGLAGAQLRKRPVRTA